MTQHAEIPIACSKGKKGMALRSAALILALVAMSAEPLPAAQKYGIITTVAGGGPNHIVATNANACIPLTAITDSQGNLYVDGCDAIFRVDHISGVMTIIAGFTEINGVDNGDGGPAIGASLSGPGGLVLDGAGNLLITTSNRIRRIDTFGNISTIAGPGEGGGCTGQTDSLGDGCPALDASLYPQGIAMDSGGNLFIADEGNQRVRRIDAKTSIITTVAGGGNGCPSETDSLGDGCVATMAILNSPTNVAVDSAGNLFFPDPNNNRVRRVDAATQIITTFAGGGSGCPGQTDSLGDGCQATAGILSSPLGVALDSASNVMVTDFYHALIRRIDAKTNIITTFAGGGSGCPGETDTDGDGCAATSAFFYYPRTPSFTNAGDVLVTDTQHFRVRSVNAETLVITTVAGNGWQGYSGDNGPATDASLFFPRGMALDSSGALLIGDFGNERVRRLDFTSGVITTIAGGGTGCPGQTDSLGDGCPATSGVMSAAAGIVRDSAGDLFVADVFNNRIRRVDAVTQVITTVAGGGAGCSGQTDTLGDGCTAINASLNWPFDIALDAAGSLFIADTQNNLIRRVDAKTQIITAIAGGGSGCPGETDTVGDGCGATNSSLNAPIGLALDSAGNLFLSDSANQRVRRVDKLTNVITTVAGNGGRGFEGDYGLATDAELQGPLGLFVDSRNNLFIADCENNRVRMVLASTGVITTIAGSWVDYFSGDGGRATSAGLNQPASVLVDAKGRMLIGDGGDLRIRKVCLFQKPLSIFDPKACD